MTEQKGPVVDREHTVCDDFPKDDGLVSRAVDLVCQELGAQISGVRLFGSRAGGAVRPSSDLDLAVLPRRPLDPMKLWELAQKAAAQTHCEVDLVDLWRASTVLQQQVVVNGTWVWVGDRPACQRFEASTLTRYGHLNRERAEIVADFLARNGKEDSVG